MAEQALARIVGLTICRRILSGERTHECQDASRRTGTLSS